MTFIPYFLEKYQTCDNCLIHLCQWPSDSITVTFPFVSLSTTDPIALNTSYTYAINPIVWKYMFKLNIYTKTEVISVTSSMQVKKS